MLRKLLFTLAVVLTANALVFAQSGTLKGKIKDKGTGETIPFAGVIVEQGGRVVSSVASDMDGNYTIKPLNPGKFDVKVTYIGYVPKQISGVVIKSDNITFLDFDMESTAVTMTEFVVSDYAIPLIDKDGGSKETMDAKQISKMAGRSVDAVVSTMGGVYSDANGNAGSVRGARAEGTVTYVDGVRVIGASVPSSSIEQISVMQGGLPAQYGDATGGIISITTKGPSKEWHGGLEYLTSELFDKYGYNDLSLSLQGPLLMVRNKMDTTKKSPLLGFFFAAQLASVKDGGPAAGGTWRVNDQKIAELTAHPLSTNTFTGGTYRNGEFLRKSDLINIKARENAGSKSANLNGKIDVKTSKNTNLTFGGNFSYSISTIPGSSLVNSKNIGQSSGNSFRVFGRFTQKFETAAETDKKRQLIKNIYYSLQADYSRNYGISQDPDKKDNLFQYGHVGTYKTASEKSFGRVDSLMLTDESGDVVKLKGGVLVRNGRADTHVDFDPSIYNPDLANYTQYIYDNWNPNSYVFFNKTNLQGVGALLNGESPAGIYGMFANTGTPYNGYSKGIGSQVGINANANADIGNHAIQFGFQYEQRSSSNISYSPAGLWTLARNLVNRQIDALDTSKWTLSVDNQNRYVVDYEQKYVQKDQSSFDYNLRKKLGLPVDSKDFIDIDSYDPSVLSVDMFNADELLNGGKSYVSYFGYDHTGKLLTKKPSFDDFFTAKDEFGNLKRQIGSFEPIYIAGYIQDKFAFNDLIFNVGLRIDRYDANQKVLKDKYSLFETVKAGDAPTSLGSIPENIGNDYVVYVDKIQNPTKIMGYRNEGTWYNAQGVEITDPNLIATSTGIAPLLLNQNQTVINSGAFKDYQPQINYLPRITFSFPISDEALFFAHYDVLTKRPTSGEQLDPTAYLFIYGVGTGTISNPDLKPEKTIDYELGFQQKLSGSSSLKISSYYREMRSMVQTTRISGAYPVSYNAYENIDFGTVKGLTVTYDLRQTKNVWLKASYTLQFADGTGSSASSGLALVNSGQPNLRSVTPLSFDRRHALSTVVDYRFSDGKEYNGPKITKIVKDKDGNEKVKVYQLLANAGANITFMYGTGIPYSRQSNITGLMGGTASILKGQLNGSRMPSQFKIDARVDKDFMVRMGNKDNKKAKMIAMNVYLQILNVLNTKNVTHVYRATGNPNDDGYLSAAEYQASINSQTDSQSFRDLYTLLVQNPYNYSLPRTIRLGLQVNF